MKYFPGQGKNELVLFNSNPYLLGYFLSKKEILFIIFGLIVFCIFLGLLFDKLLLAFITSLIILFGGLAYLLFLGKNTKFFITSERIVKIVQTGLFWKHRKELLLNQLNESIYTKNGLIANLFKYGNVKFIGKDKENTIWFENIKYPDEISQYVTRLKIFLEKNPDLKPSKFVPRKLRKSN